MSMSALPVEAPDEGVLFVVSGPSGVGKSTLLANVFARIPHLGFSVSATTRPPRPGEEDGRDYHFVTRERFAELEAAGDLLECATVYGQSYGTPRAPVEQAMQQGRSIVLDIDVQGKEQVCERLAEAVTVFIMPPGSAELEARLRGRGTDADEVISRRMREAYAQVQGASAYDYVVFNDDLSSAQECLCGIMLAELMRVPRRSTRMDAILLGFSQRVLE